MRETAHLLALTRTPTIVLTEALRPETFTLRQVAGASLQLYI